MLGFVPHVRNACRHLHWTFSWLKRLTLACRISPPPLSTSQMQLRWASSAGNTLVGRQSLYEVTDKTIQDQLPSAMSTQPMGNSWVLTMLNGESIGFLLVPQTPAIHILYRIIFPQVSFPLLRPVKQTSNQDMKWQSSLFLSLQMILLEHPFSFSFSLWTLHPSKASRSLSGITAHCRIREGVGGAGTYPSVCPAWRWVDHSGFRMCDI